MKLYETRNELCENEETFEKMSRINVNVKFRLPFTFHCCHHWYNFTK